MRAVVTLSPGAKQAMVLALKPPLRMTSLEVATGTAISTKAGQVLGVKLLALIGCSMVESLGIANSRRWGEVGHCCSR